MRQRAAGRDERLRHELPTKSPRQVLARVRSDKRVVSDAVESQYRYQLLEIRHQPFHATATHAQIFSPSTSRITRIGRLYGMVKGDLGRAKSQLGVWLVKFVRGSGTVHGSRCLPHPVSALGPTATRHRVQPT
jgi:hypothetical protein